jgi:hypothetical protein
VKTQVSCRCEQFYGEAEEMSNILKQATRPLKCEDDLFVSYNYKFVKNFVGKISGKTPLERIFIKTAVDKIKFKGVSRSLIGSDQRTERSFLNTVMEIGRSLILHIFRAVVII